MKTLTTLLIGLLLLCIALVSNGQNEFKNLDGIKAFKEKLKHPENFEKEFENQSQQQHFAPDNKSLQEDWGDPPDWKWESQIGGSGSDYSRDVISDPEGNIYIAGSFSGDIEYGSYSFTSLGRWDALVAKFDNASNCLWIKQFSASQDEKIEIFSIDLDNTGNLYMTGYFTGNVTLGDYTLWGSSEYSSLFLAKLNTTGDVLMANDPAVGANIGIKVDSDEEGNIYIIGSNNTSLNFHYSYLIKCDPNGSHQWTSENSQSFNDMVVFESNIYFAGSVTSPGYIGEFYVEPLNYDDVFIAKSDLEGNFEWVSMAEHDGNSGDSRGFSLYLDINEDIYLAGNFRYNVLFGDILLESTNAGGFITKCNPDGEFVWASKTTSYPNLIDVCGDENFVYSGYKNIIDRFDASDGTSLGWNGYDYDIKSICFEAPNNNLVTTGQVNQIIYLSQLYDNLEEQWFIQFNGNSAFAEVTGLATDNSGNLYTCGYASNEIDYDGQAIPKGSFFYKQNNQQDIIWLKYFPDIELDMGYGSCFVADTLNQYLYMASQFNEPWIIPGVTTLIPDSTGSTAILKYDMDANWQWAIQEDFRGEYLCLSPDRSGNILLCGVFDGDISIGGTQLTSAGLSDVFVAKYDASGEFLWAKRAGGEGIEYGGAISVDGNDNVYLTGEFTSENITIDDYSIILEEGDGNIFYAKLNPDGNVQWTTSFGGSSIYMGDYSCWPTGIITDDEGYSYIKGWHGDSVYFDNIFVRSPYGLNYSYFSGNQPHVRSGENVIVKGFVEWQNTSHRRTDLHTIHFDFLPRRHHRRCDSKTQADEKGILWCLMTEHGQHTEQTNRLDCVVIGCIIKFCHKGIPSTQACKRIGAILDITGK